jgi:Ser/Thr protein kinase RdoA (MazF antagonist)
MTPVEAAELVGADLVGRLGGEVGAFEVRWEGRRGVMKVFVAADDRVAARRGQELVERLRARGFPAPAQRVAAESEAGLVLVQEWMQGRVEDIVDHALVDDVLVLNALQDGIVHGDFHHRNLLTENRRVTAVVDWDDAIEGDPVFDLVTLAFCSVAARCEAGAVERLWAHALAMRDGESIAGWVRDLTRRQVEWSQRHRTPDDVGFWRDAGESALELVRVI